MKKLPILSSRQVIEVLRTAGFKNAPKRGKGSHLAMVKQDSEKRPHGPGLSDDF
jgi:predicted RNA binding protein YcfA (HicA-like mRNA interferase family)